MRAILKYRLSELAIVEEITVAKDAERLGVYLQNNKPVLYVLGTPHDDTRTIEVDGCVTGEPTDRPISQYLGSAMIDEGGYVIHYFSPDL